VEFRELEILIKDIAFIMYLLSGRESVFREIPVDKSTELYIVPDI